MFDPNSMEPSDSSGKRRGLLWLLGAVIFAAVVAGAIPRLARHIPFSVEKKLASWVGVTDRFRVCRSPEAQAALDTLVARLYPLSDADRELPIRVQVVSGDEVNAFAFLGADIYIYDGLLQEAQSGDEVAGVLAHEIAHVSERHIMQNTFTRLLSSLMWKLVGLGDGSLSEIFIQMSFTREMEAQADLKGLERMKSAKVGTEGFSNFFSRAALEKKLPAILSDHPSSQDRLRMISEFSIPDPQPVLTPGEFLKLKSICR